MLLLFSIAALKSLALVTNNGLASVPSPLTRTVIWSPFLRVYVDISTFPLTKTIYSVSSPINVFNCVFFSNDSKVVSASTDNLTGSLSKTVAVISTFGFSGVELQDTKANRINTAIIKILIYGI